MHEHLINPVFYVEFEDTSAADKSLIEVVGFDSQYDGLVPNRWRAWTSSDEIETKLILSSNLNGWNICRELHCREEPGRRVPGSSAMPPR